MTRMRVYVVTEGEYSDYRIQAMFTNEAAAQAFVAIDGGEIETWEVHETVPPRVRWHLIEQMGGKVRRLSTLRWPWDGSGYVGEKRKAWNYHKWQYGERAFGTDKAAVEKAWTEQHIHGRGSTGRRTVTALYRHTDRLPDGTGAGMPADALADDLRAGRLEQACPCGRWEAAGARCTGCLRRTGPNDWYRNGDMERRIAVVGPARAAEEARPKAQRGGRGRGPWNTQTPVNGTPDADGGDTGNPTPSGAAQPVHSDSSRDGDHGTALLRGAPDPRRRPRGQRAASPAAEVIGGSGAQTLGL